MSGLSDQSAKKARVAFGRAVREQRLSRGLRQADLAEQVGVAGTYISHLEAGDRNPSLVTQLALARALGIPLRELVDWAESALDSQAGKSRRRHDS